MRQWTHRKVVPSPDGKMEEGFLLAVFLTGGPESELELSKRKAKKRKKVLHVDKIGKREGERIKGPSESHL